ncbi:hypothetical protein [Komagataeibacter xylinus]|uniref:Uncharacterized protein n=1 Tax=Komagataeibacter xylinus TaxID=28448 RepID=A0A857FQF8_KOMXY|nr:hypothetical protein [Komagataeibacter xylinus]QHC36435.1 hypothetical protein FMA36_13845 [Komagataeibacter xylinus]
MSAARKRDWRDHPIFRGTVLGKEVYDFTLQQDRDGNYVGYLSDPHGCRISIIAKLTHQGGKHMLKGRGLLTGTNDTGEEPKHG